MINIPVSVGEVIDKLSILQVKKTKLSNPEKLIYVEKEFEILYNLSSEFLSDTNIENIYHQLVKVNSELWDIEDNLRIFEKKGVFDNEFLELARNVYFTNDKRFELKNEINHLTSSEIIEVKEYVSYKN